MPKLKFVDTPPTSQLNEDGTLTDEAKKIYHELPEGFEENISNSLKLDLST